MRRENLIRILIIGFLISGCSTPPLPPSSTVASPTTIVPTLTPIPPSSTATENPATLTPLPTYTEKPPTSTSTPEPGLQTNGPYFAYFQESNLTLRLVIVDADGNGQKTIELPKAVSDSFAEGALSTPDIRLLSPDGKWLAFYTGSPKTTDLTLNLLNLETGETQVVTLLLSKDYPNNFTEAAATLNDPNITADSLHEAFMEGITQAIAWSPDGQHLAFAGQMDGLSSDLYVYDVQTKKIQRLSSGDQQLQWINWSPDGKRIVHSAVYSVGEGMTYDIYVASMDSPVVPHISNNVLSSGIEDWLNDHQYLEYDGQNGPGNYGLRIVDINNGGITKLWDGSFGYYVVDKSKTWVMLSDAFPLLGDNPNFVPNFYLVNLKTYANFKVEVPDSTHDYGDIRSFGVGGQTFILMDQNSNTPIFLSAAGAWTPSALGNGWISTFQMSTSPDSKYWLAVADDIKIFSADNVLQTTSASPFTDSNVHFSWRPDSSGVFLISNGNMFSMDVPTGDIEPIETDLLRTQTSLTYGWINGQ